MSRRPVRTSGVLTSVLPPATLVDLYRQALQVHTDLVACLDQVLRLERVMTGLLAQALPQPVAVQDTERLTPIMAHLAAVQSFCTASAQALEERVLPLPQAG